MVKFVRSIARRHLPDHIRKPLGDLLGPIENKVIAPLAGLLFDLSGGVFRTDGLTFSVPKKLTSKAFRSAFWRSDYELEERSLIKRFVRPADRVLEFGACLGIVSCTTNRLLQEKTKHVVVEANPKVIPFLYENRARNGAEFLIEHCAVSSRPEETFYLHPIYIVGGNLDRKTDEPVRLPGRSWRELDARYGPFTTLIIDVEGGELGIFEASPELLARYRLIVVELHPWAIGEEKVDRCRELLQIAGFHFRDRMDQTEAWERD